MSHESRTVLETTSTCTAAKTGSGLGTPLALCRPVMAAPLHCYQRRTARFLSGASILWNYFTDPERPRRGMIRDISSSGLLLCTGQEIEDRRWLRLIIRHPESNLARVLRGRVVRQEPALDSWPDEQITLHRQGIELIDPIPEDWVESLSNEHLAVCGCGSLVERKKPANPAGNSNEICGLCFLRETLLTSRP